MGLTCSAIENKGINEIYNTINLYFEHQSKNGFVEHNRLLQAKHWFSELLNEKILADFYQHPKVTEKLAKTLNDMNTTTVHINKEVEAIFTLYKK